MNARRLVIIGAVALFVAVIGVILVLTATTNPETFAPYAAPLNLIRAAGAGDDQTALSYTSDSLRTWINTNCPMGISACVGGYVPPEWGAFRSVVFRRAEPVAADAYDVEVIATYERDLGFSGVCIYTRVVQAANEWKVDGWAGWISCGDNVARDLAQNYDAPNRVLPTEVTMLETMFPRTATPTPTPTSTPVPTETPTPTETPAPPTATLNAAPIESAVDFVEAVGAQNNLDAQRLIHPEFRVWVAENCPTGAIATCLNFLLPDEWGALVSAVFQRATLIDEQWYVELITQFEAGINIGGICMFVRMRNADGRWLVAGWGGWLRCNNPAAENMITNPDVPNRAP
jgi:hypothetical protein